MTKENNSFALIKQAKPTPVCGYVCIKQALPVKMVRREKIKINTISLP